MQEKRAGTLYEGEMARLGMEKSGKRGKIPQSDWPLIMARYEQGETLSSIARTYDCSPPAISYIVSRSREKTTNEATPTPTEPQLVKVATSTTANDGSAALEPSVVPAEPAAAVRRESASEFRPLPPANGVLSNGASPNGDQRRTLHLSRGNGASGSVHDNPAANGHGAEQPARSSFASPRIALPPDGATGQRLSQAPDNLSPPNTGRNGRELFIAPEGRPAAQQPRDAENPRREGSAFIDQELRSRVDGDIAAFLAAFDAALAADTQESRFGLREATDRLLRAGARTRIELERLEARVPLSAREGGAEAPPTTWRYR